MKPRTLKSVIAEAEHYARFGKRYAQSPDDFERGRKIREVLEREAPVPQRYLEDALQPGQFTLFDQFAR